MKTKLLLAVIYITFACDYSNAQSLSGDLSIYLNSWLSDIPGSSGDDYTEPTQNQLSEWKSLLSEVSNQNITTARSIAAGLNYQLTEYIDDVNVAGQLYYILEEQIPKKYHWGIYILNSDPCRKDLIIQATHPKYDLNTGEQAIYCFSKLNARGLFISGTHRCNHSLVSSCDGSTSVCGGSAAPFRISDMAHNTSSIFQITTEVIFEENRNSIFVQLHGFNKTATDPSLILSNGSRYTPSTDYIVQLKEELSKIDNTLSFKIAHVDLSWDKNIALTNTQGRLLNGSSSPCFADVNFSNGNFIHIEQEKEKLRSDSVGWQKIFLALSNTFPCEVVSAAFEDSNSKTIKVFPNPVSNHLLTIISEDKHIKSLSIWDMLGRNLMNVNSLKNSNELTIDVADWPQGIYFISIQLENSLFVKKVFVE